MNDRKHYRLLFVFLLLGAFSMLARAQWSAIYTFNGNVEGDLPNQPSLLAQGTDGNLYGTLPQGGRANGGAWFQYNMSGKPMLTSFRGYVDNTGKLSGDTLMSGSNSGYSLGIDGNFYGAVDFGNGTGYGAIIRSSGGVPTQLYQFKGTVNGNPDGYYPNAPPTQGLDLNLYGVTKDYGSSGVAYQFLTATNTRGWTVVLPGGSTAPLLLGSDGNFYGTYSSGNFSTVNGLAVANQGGAGGIFQLTPAGVIGWYHNLTGGTTDGGTPIGPVMQGADGYLYGTASGGGAGYGVVFKIAASSTSIVNTAYTVIHPLSQADGEAPHTGLVQGSDGCLYGLTTTGGTLPAQVQAAGYQAAGTLFKVSTAGLNFTVLNTFWRVSGTDGLGTGSDPESTFVLHTNGTIYGWTHSGGFNLFSNGGPGSFDDGGEFFQYNAGLSPFISVVGRRSAHVGDRVGIIGQGFLNATGVSFGGVSASWTKFNVIIWNDNYMTVVVPAGARTGTVTVQETNGPLSTLYNFTIACSGLLCRPIL